MSQQAEARATEVFRKHGGIMTTKEAVDSGVQYRTLYSMRDQGLLERVSRGRYRLAELAPLSDPDLSVVGLRIPKAVICLLSALRFHGLTTQVPHAVYIALPRGSAQPRLEHPPIRVFKFSGQALSEGIEVHDIDGISIRIYSPAKTIADCFKFRNQVGLDVALEALKMYRQTPGFDINEVTHFARICRVEKVMRPYLEAIL